MRPLPLAAVLGAATAAVYALAVRTAAGQRLEDETLHGFADGARLYPFARDVGLPPLDLMAPTLAAGVLVVVAVGAARRRWVELMLALVAVGGSLVATEVLGEGLRRPPLDVSTFGATGNTFPSGHAAIPVALVLAVVLVSPPAARTWVAGLGGLWAALVAAGIQSMNWHRPSDVVGSVLITGACTLVVWSGATRLLPAVEHPTSIRPGPVLGAAAVVALVAPTRTDSWTVPLLFSAVAWFAVALPWVVVRALAQEAPLRPGTR